MTTDTKSPRFKGPNSPLCGLPTFLFIIFLTFLFFLLAQSMVRHHFHEGGRMGSNGEIR